MITDQVGYEENRKRSVFVEMIKNKLLVRVAAIVREKGPNNDITDDKEDVY